MSNSDYLYARPSLIEGVASLIDLFGTLQEYNKSKSPEEADAWAIWNDFRSTGKDIENALEKYRSSIYKDKQQESSVI